MGGNAPELQADRRRRKAEHLAAVREIGDNAYSTTWLEDLHLIPDCMPELAWDEVSLHTQLCGVALASPIVINAMTGGAPESYEVNRRLAMVAKKHHLAMAVGSETSALRDPDMAYTYEVIREVNPDGVVIANVGMGCTAEDAKRAVDLVGANLLQVHWNVAQELFMAEGDRDFHGAPDALAQVVAEIDVPVIAKEVGQGIAAEQARRFVQLGVDGIDVGGVGGTNFMAVEAHRRGWQLAASWHQWGLTTAASLCEVVGTVGDKVDVVASGGIRTAHDIVKSMAVGASAVGIAGEFLRRVSGADERAALDAVDHYVEELHWSLRTLLILTGSRTWQDMRTRPVVVTGRLREWLEARGFADFAVGLARRGLIEVS
ncbi:type 2 isopentenyl-diphosphate Delta-isomerase [Alicyclobacillus kakegawensis]|uniref:type 2 isopentenyl-diphosphate Delta-isomerase n=1 Tax=Alicyclobacillus kakegawensis TaxID=392012 RepID=UPI0008379007|nr:type 2 isopentenyl-diphosphate Delta-isomerase [Alicyclobacillus kakegawensis]